MVRSTELGSKVKFWAAAKATSNEVNNRVIRDCMVIVRGIDGRLCGLAYGKQSQCSETDGR